MKKQQKSSKSYQNKIVSVYIPPELLSALKAELANSDLESLSGLLRQKVLNRKVVRKSCDVTLDRLMWLLSSIRTKLYLMGSDSRVFIQQIASHNWDSEDQTQMQHVVGAYEKINGNVPDNYEFIDKISYLWLPE